MADGNNNPNDPFGDFLQWFFSQDLGDKFNHAAEPANDDTAPFDTPEKPVVARKMGSAEYFEI
jgi:hypothetical protein